jgi:hypothetical protein
MRHEERPAGTKPTKLIIGGLAIVLSAGGGYYLLKDQIDNKKAHELPTKAVALPTPEPLKPAEKPSYEEPAAAARPEPLPALNQSDVAVVAALQGLKIDGLLHMMITEEILRKFVRAVDAVEEGKIITEYRPVVSPQGTFATASFQASVATGSSGETEQVEQFRVSENNFKRYDIYANLLSLLNSDAAVSLYKRFYPLLNEAYQEMGVNKGNFHSVLIRAIDNILGAPEATGDIILIHPKVYFQFADPALESLPETHKLMLRMGPANESSAKSSLKDLRVKLLQK